MKIFWALMAILTAAAAFLVFSSDDAPTAVTQTAATGVEDVASSEPTVETLDVEDESSPAEPAASPSADATLDEMLGVEPEASGESPELVDASRDVPDVLPQTPAGEHAPGHKPASVAPPPRDEDRPAADPEQSMETQDDGSIVIADRYVVTGSGTKADPYEAPWDLIMTARDTYRPRLGRKEIPSGLEMLDGKYVRINGYMLLPFMGTDIRELLLMRNQWDGCCIGVPPTPYDAIEVKLEEAPTQLSRFRVNFGSVTGKFKIDPYERKDWLLSLYIMEEASLKVTGF